MKPLLFSLFFVSICFSATTAFAQSSTSTATSTPVIDEAVNSIREQIQERVVGNNDTRPTALQKPTQDRLINLAANISNRFDAIIARLQNVHGRLVTRIEKLNNEGINTEAAASALSNADAALKKAKTEMSTIDEAMTGALGSTNPLERWRTVRAKYVTARDDIQIAFTELRNTISLLKNSGPRTASTDNTATTSINSI